MSAWPPPWLRPTDSAPPPKVETELVAADSEADASGVSMEPPAYNPSPDLNDGDVDGCGFVYHRGAWRHPDYLGLATPWDDPSPPADAEAAPNPPPGARLVYQDHHGPCDRLRALRWCWLGGPRWYDAARFPPPAEPLEAP